MSKREFLAHEAMTEPEPLIDSIVDYLLFLKSKIAEPRFESLMASYPTLAKDWFNTEEEEAWKDYQ